MQTLSSLQQWMNGKQEISKSWFEECSVYATQIFLLCLKYSAWGLKLSLFSYHWILLMVHAINSIHLSLCYSWATYFTTQPQNKYHRVYLYLSCFLYISTIPFQNIHLLLCSLWKPLLLKLNHQKNRDIQTKQHGQTSISHINSSYQSWNSS